MSRFSDDLLRICFPKEARREVLKVALISVDVMVSISVPVSLHTDCEESNTASAESFNSVS